MNENTVGVLVGIFLFGVIYALIVYIPLHGKHGGYTSLLVSFGVVATLAACILLIGLTDTLWVAAAFICAGVPMIAGEAIRSKYDELHRE